ncbi:ubiquitin-conjugating enzyme E2 [Rhizoctonia solani AG-3 Rhs1AP]|uniref:Ubiquitin-conjugating enzyme E2 6 n=1 Tax=Rhizoctonia solani AG-3 Rhs1AP TaxID=1086054 RepID=A0A0A1UL39_9AGAM|nr:ubiquitin-conjugating enzyme E2 [Rhizoctonia solani AG-3 Rhs1AP]
MASKPAQKRLSKEFLAMQRSPPPFVWASPEEKNILHWNFIVRGPPDCPFAGGEYHGLISFPSDYPFKPPGIKMYTPSGRFQPDKKICFSMSDFHPGTWNPAWSVATICTGLLSFMLSDEMTTGSVTSTDAEKRDFALRSHEWNRKQKRFRDAFPDYCAEEMKDLPNMGEQDRGAAEDSTTTQEAQANPSNLAPAVRSSAPTVAKARTAPTPGAASAVVGQAVAPASWRETIWERWRWGIFILLAVLVSRLSNV